MNELTLLCYGGNNEQDEQLRLSFFFDSVLKQENSSVLKVIFADCTPHSNKFVIPQNEQITVVSMPTKDEELHPAFIRNSLVLLADTQFIVHVNPDNYYSSNFFTILLKRLKENSKRLIMCRKYMLSQQQFIDIKQHDNPKEFIEHCIKTHKIMLTGCNACGDCQGMSRQLFINSGGYYKGIVNGKAQQGDKKYHSVGEDLYLKRYAEAKQWRFSLAGKHYEVRRGAEILSYWIHTENCWMCHLWHPGRRCLGHHKKIYKDVH